MRKKILFVIDSLNSGGAEKSLVSLLNLLDYNKYEIDLLTFKEGGLYSSLLPKAVRLIEIPDIFQKMKFSILDLIKRREFKFILWRIKTSINLRYTPKLTNISHGAQLMWRNLDSVISKLNTEYDIAIAYSQGTPTYYVAEKVKAKRKLCWVNIDYEFARYNRDFDLNYYQKFNNIVAVSNLCADVFKRVFPEFENKTVIMYDIISKNLIDKMANKENGFNDNFQGIRILTIGRLVYQKGYEYAIEAAKYLKDKNINFKWYSIGEGDLKNKLEKMVDKYNLQNNFEFLGTFINPYPFIKHCDIYCQPSRFEGFGLAIAEARILNKPIVATNFEIVYDQIEDRKNGLVVDMNVESVANGILELINNKELTNNITEYLKTEKKGNVEELDKFYEMIGD